MKVAPAQDSDHWGTISFMQMPTDWKGQKDNMVKTTRYTLWSFIPLTLWENFRVVTNIYFLIILIVSFLPWSPLSYVFSLAPLIFVLAVSMIKAGVEDLLKYREDVKKNADPVKIYKHGEWIQAESREIQPGDLVLQEGDAMVAADMLFVTSSNDNQSCNYSEAQLNGENAVKTITVHPAFKQQQFPQYLYEKQFRIEIPAPSRDLFKFDAKLIDKEGQTYAVAIHNVLLRGMNLHYCEWVMGIALCTGHNTKVMMNMRHPPAKVTQFDKDVNLLVLGIFILKMCLILVLSGVCCHYEKGSVMTFEMVSSSISSKGSSFLTAFMQYFVLYSYLIPISMMVTIEIVRMYHMFMITWDKLLVDPVYGDPEPHNSNIIAQLGSVTHVLSDKTGTLTENIMELVGFCDASGKFSADEFVSEGDKQRSLPFLQALALCNTVIVHTTSTGVIQYNSESPDEAAFVEFAAKCGVVLMERTPESVSIEIFGEKVEYEIVSLVPFTSERKRMTIVLREAGQDSLIVYTKGADSIMYQRVNEVMFKDEVLEYATSGWRTLVFGQKVLSGKDSSDWMITWHEAASKVVGRDEAIAEVSTFVESELDVLGVSAIEDRLQQNVKETVEWLRQANISLWVLTGDKLETAIEIGKTSAVIGSGSTVLIVGQSTERAVEAQLRDYLNSLRAWNDPVLVLTDQASEIVLTSLSELFLSLAMRCKSVIFSRVSPFQKASIVSLLNTRKEVKTLAIGDGANDVGMLQEANVGIGVKGHEGSQAAQAADFAVPRFRHLVPMIAVHGHWALHRIAHLAVFMLYKNFAMIMVYFFSSIDTAASPADFYNEFLLSCYNLIFTMLPPFAYGFWERDNRKQDLLRYPYIYNTLNNPMKPPEILKYVFLAIWQGFVVYYCVRFAYPEGALESNGNICYFAIVCVVAVQFLAFSYDWNGWIIATCSLTYVLLFSLFIGYAYLLSPTLIGVVEETLGNIRAWACFLICMFAGNFPYIAISNLANYVKPTLSQLIREREKYDRMTTLDFTELMQLNQVYMDLDDSSIDSLADEDRDVPDITPN